MSEELDKHERAWAAMLGIKPERAVQLRTEVRMGLRDELKRMVDGLPEGNVPDVYRFVAGILAANEAQKATQNADTQSQTTPDGYCRTCGFETNRGHCACPCTDEDCDLH